MSSNEDLAAAYLEDAQYSLAEARRAFNEGLHHRAVRRCQEAVELSLKAVLRLYGIEYPKQHEVGTLLLRLRGKIPQPWRKKVKRVAQVSSALALQRAPAFYGDEAKGLSPKRLFTIADANRSLSRAAEVQAFTQELIHAWKARPRRLKKNRDGNTGLTPSKTALLA